MLNNHYYIGGNTNNQKCVVNLNQPSSGFIQKSNPVSRFIRFQRGTKIEDMLFPTDPRQSPCIEYTEEKWIRNEGEPWKDYSYGEKRIVEVIVLQVCIFGDDYMLAEYVLKKDLEEESK